MNLIVYGSLINKEELLKEGIVLDNVETVKVFGYRRVFNQEPSYRFLDSKNRAVLNIIKDEAYWFNAILIKELSDKYFEALDVREKGYQRITIDVETYTKKVIKNCFVYSGKEEKRSLTILPNKEYLKLCLEGAKSFGELFYFDYLKTTYQNDKSSYSLI